MRCDECNQPAVAVIYETGADQAADPERMRFLCLAHVTATLPENREAVDEETISPAEGERLYSERAGS